jgi:hypothetical protein
MIGEAFSTSACHQNYFNANPKEISFLQVGDEFRKAYISIASTVQHC